MNRISAVREHPPTTTQDAFFNGKFELIQPNDGSHRAGLDALLLSACVPFDFAGKLADFGAGAGAAGMAVACRNFAADVDLIERNTEITALTRRALKLPANRKMYGRVNIICADVTLSGKAREDAGIANSTYNWVIMNPPFNDSAHRPSPVVSRQDAHIMGIGGLDPWLRSAAATLKAGGRVALIFRPSGIGLILAAFQGRFGSAQIIPVHPKAREAANRILVIADKGSKGATAIRPGFVVHKENGEFTNEAKEIFSGNRALS